MRLLLFIILTISWCTADDDPVHMLTDVHYNIDDDKGVHGTYPVHKFVTSKLRAPVANFLNWTHHCDDGLYTFITPRGWSVRDPGPMILDSNGSLIWAQHFANEFGGQAYDLKVQSYKGQEYLTFWLGDDRVRGHGHGHFHMLDKSYKTVRTITAGNGMLADLHDLVITPHGTALLIVYHIASFDLRPHGRKYNDLWNQAIWECRIQEINIESEELLFEWKASDHINVSTSYKSLETVDTGTRENPFDPFHLNSIQKDSLGNYLISARNTHSIYYVSGRTKETIWTFGGEANQFMDLSGGHAINFAWQHDARFADSSIFSNFALSPSEDGITTALMTIFDNAAVDYDYVYGDEYSRGLLLELRYPTPGIIETAESRPLDTQRTVREAFTQTELSKLDAEKVERINGSHPQYTVRIIQEFRNPKSIRSGTQGSMQVIPSANGEDPRVFVGYGLNAVATTFDSHGSVSCDMHYGAETSWEKGDIQSYRAFKFDWIGAPTTAPEIDVRRDQIFASWNGATEVRQWLLQSSDSGLQSEWVDISRTDRQGFESTISLPRDIHDSRFLRVLALDGDGQLCEHGISRALDRGRFGAIMKEHLPSTDFSDSRAPAMAVMVPIGLIVLYQVLLRFLRWRIGRGGWRSRR